MWASILSIVAASDPLAASAHLWPSKWTVGTELCIRRKETSGKCHQYASKQMQVRAFDVPWRVCRAYTRDLTSRQFVRFWVIIIRMAGQQCVFHVATGIPVISFHFISVQVCRLMPR